VAVPVVARHHRGQNIQVTLPILIVLVDRLPPVAAGALAVKVATHSIPKGLTMLDV